MKSVSFAPNVKIQHMHVWSFAYHEARKNNINWISNILDRERFKLRKQILEEMLTEIGFFRRPFEIKKQLMEKMLTEIGFFSRMNVRLQQK